MFRTAVVILVTLFIGALIGASFQPPAKVEFVEVPHTKIIYRDAEDPPPAPPAPPLSDECKAALRFANGAVKHAEKVYASGDTQLQIISDARIALFDADSLALIQERQQRLHNSTVGALADLEEAIDLYHSTIKLCKEPE
jgi:hypothetical protein